MSAKIPEGGGGRVSLSGPRTNKSTTEHCNADRLYWLPLKQEEREEMGVDSSEVFHASQFVPYLYSGTPHYNTRFIQTPA